MMALTVDDRTRIDRAIELTRGVERVRNVGNAMSFKELDETSRPGNCDAMRPGVQRSSTHAGDLR
jgi:hypothetical protein